MATARDILIIVQLQDQASRGLRALGREVEGLAAPVATVAKVAAAAATAFTAAASGVIGLGVSFLNMREQAEVGLGFVVRNAELAKDMIANLVAFARANPVPVEPLIQAARVLAGYGYEASKVVPTLKAIADANAAIGGTTETFNRIAYAIAQVVAKGRLQAEEVRQLANAGIPALAILAEKTGETQANLLKAMRDGTLGAESVGQLITGIQERFQGALAALGDTMGGMITRIRNIGKEWASIAAEPAFETIKTHLRDILSIMESPAFLESARTFADILRGVIGGVGAIGGAVRGIGTGVTAAAPGTFQFGGGEGEDIGATRAANEAAKAWENVQNAIGEVVLYIQAYVVPVLKEAWSLISTAIRTEVVPALLTLRDNFFETFNTHIMPIVSAGIDALGHELSRFGPWVQDTLIPALSNMIEGFIKAVGVIVEIFRTLWPMVKPHVVFLVEAVGRTLATIRDTIALIFALMAGDWEGAWNLLKDIAIRILEGLRSAVAHIVEDIILAFIPIPRKVLDAIRNNTPWFGSRPTEAEMFPNAINPRSFGGGEGEDVGGNGSAGGLGAYLANLFKDTEMATKEVTTSLADLKTNFGDLDLSLTDLDGGITKAAESAGRAARTNDDYIKLLNDTNKLHLQATARVAEETMEVAERMAQAKKRIEDFFLSELQQLAQRGTRFAGDSFNVWAEAAGLQPIGNFPVWSDGKQINPAFDAGGNKISVELSSDLQLAGVP